MSNTGLTPEQEKLADAYLALSAKRIMCTDPIDELKAFTYSKKLMDWLTRPFLDMIVVDSPLQACYVAHLILGGECLFPSYRENNKNPKHNADLAAKAQTAFLESAEPYCRVSGAEEAQRILFDALRAGLRAVWPALKTSLWGKPKLISDAEHAELANRPRPKLVGMELRDLTQERPVTDEAVWTTLKGVARLLTHWGALDVPLDRLGQTGKTRSEALRKESGKIGAYLAGWAEAVAGSELQAVWPYLDGQFFAQYVTWYEFYRDVLKLDIPGVWQIDEQIEFGGVYPLNQYALISRRPEIFTTTPEYLYHGKECQPALRYRDSFGICQLNGVAVPEWLALLPPAEIDPKRFLDDEIRKNAEVRREFVRKIGPERLYTALGGEVVDKPADDRGYELVRLDLGGQTGWAHYLKMVNPSIGVVHLEGVPPDIATVQDALAWRNQTDVAPSQLT